MRNDSRVTVYAGDMRSGCNACVPESGIMDSAVNVLNLSGSAANSLAEIISTKPFPAAGEPNQCGDAISSDCDSEYSSQPYHVRIDDNWDL